MLDSLPALARSSSISFRFSLSKSVICCSNSWPSCSISALYLLTYLRENKQLISYHASSEVKSRFCLFSEINHLPFSIKVNGSEGRENVNFHVLCYFTYYRLVLRFSRPNKYNQKKEQASTSVCRSLMRFSLFLSVDSRPSLFFTASWRVLHSAKALCSFLLHSVTFAFKDLISDWRADTWEKRRDGNSNLKNHYFDENSISRMPYWPFRICAGN